MGRRVMPVLAAAVVLATAGCAVPAAGGTVTARTSLSPMPVAVSTPPTPTPTAASTPPTRPPASPTAGRCLGADCGISLSGDWLSLQTGDCLNYRHTSTDLIFTRTSCTHRHQYEIYAAMRPDTLTPIRKGETRAAFNERTCPHALLAAYAPRYAARHPNSAQESGSWGDGTNERICVVAADNPTQSIRSS